MGPIRGEELSLLLWPLLPLLESLGGSSVWIWVVLIVGEFGLKPVSAAFAFGREDVSVVDN